MPTIAHRFDWPDRVVVGTIGRPGSREFYLQARVGTRIVSVGLEKQQSAALAEKIDELLDELMAREGNPASIPAQAPTELADHDPLEQPVDARFRTGVISLGWDASTAQVVVEAYPYVEDDADGETDDAEPAVLEPDEVLMVRMPVGTARAFVMRTREVVGAGRPTCPLCGAPIDGGGHVCALPDDF
ncbi:MAG: DUF3090 domain-containing protein [Microbacteriaceae bacterium]